MHDLYRVSCRAAEMCHFVRTAVGVGGACIESVTGRNSYVLRLSADDLSDLLAVRPLELVIAHKIAQGLGAQP